MAIQIDKTVAIADRIVSLVEDGLRPIEQTIGTWPAEFQAIIWEAVANIAFRRASALRQGQSG